MSLYTHLVFSLFFVQLFRILLPYDVKVNIFFYLMAVIGNLICFTPDVAQYLYTRYNLESLDKKLTEKLGFSWLSKNISYIDFKDFFNSILFLIVFSIFSYTFAYIIRLDFIYITCSVIGVISHMICESFSVSGVRLLFPAFIRFSLVTKKDSSFRGFVRGSKAEKILALIFLILFLLLLPIDSYKKIIHSIIQNPVGALSDVKYESSENITLVHVKGIHNITHERIDKDFKAIGWIGANSVVVEDLETGKLYSVGKGLTDQIQPFSMEEKTGAKVILSNQTVSVHNTNIKKIISMLDSKISDPNTSVYITGDLYTDDEHYHVTTYPTEYNPIKQNQKHLELQFARLDDLDRLRNTHITSGKLALRFEKPIETGIAHAGELNYNKTNKTATADDISDDTHRIKISFSALDMSDIKVKIGQKVKKGDLLVVSSKDIDTLELENKKSNIDYSKLNNDIAKIRTNYKEKIEAKERELKYNKELLADNLISEQAVKNIEN
ncbi:metal-dependent hydrolase, partial [Thermodesulfobium sp.]